MPRTRAYRKQPLVETEIGMSFAEYVIDAGRRGLKQIDMARELGVQPITLGRWLEDAELEQAVVYRRRKVAA